MEFFDSVKYSDIWERMQHIGLDEMKTVKLMSRIDTKYVNHEKNLLPMLEHAAENRYMVQCSPTPLNGYSTTYYDTEDLEMYLMHHNQKLHRQKIRCRTYTDSGVSFLEIKDKSNKGRTSKVRMPVSNPSTEQLRKENDVCKFIGSNTDFEFKRLVPSVETDFQRITLVNPQKTERITIDVDLCFKNFINGKSASLDHLIIIELKQDGRYLSEMKNILRDLHVKPFHLSKYCIGTAMTNSDVKANRFRRKLHLINKIRS